MGQEQEKEQGQEKEKEQEHGVGRWKAGRQPLHCHSLGLAVWRQKEEE